MPTVTCDRCESEFTAPDSKERQKIECPHCGDMNIVEPAPSPRPAGGAGRAPDRSLLFVRPAVTRSHPVVSLLLLLAPGAAVIVAGALGWLPSGVAWAWWLLVPIAGWGLYGALWLVQRYNNSLEITTRGTIQRRGILYQVTREVFHHQVMEVKIEQSLLDRMLGVGRVRVTDFSKDAFEIDFPGARDPDGVADVINGQRPRRHGDQPFIEGGG